MPAPAFFRRLPADLQAALDAEIRRRGYGDCVGLVAWLAERGVEISKTSLHKRAVQLRAADDSTATPELSPETARLIVECASLALKTLSAFSLAYEAIRYEQQRTAKSG